MDHETRYTSPLRSKFTFGPHVSILIPLPSFFGLFTLHHAIHTCQCVCNALFYAVAFLLLFFLYVAFFIYIYLYYATAFSDNRFMFC